MLLTFESGVSVLQVSIPIEDDGLFENNEVFCGNLRFPTGVVPLPGVRLNPDRANATILNNDRKNR